MPVISNKLTEKDSNAIVNMAEGQFSDVKAKEAKPSALTEDISAFANSDGGELFIGIDELDDASGRKFRRWRGFFNQEEANNHLATFDKVSPLDTGLTYEFLECEKQPGVVLHVIVSKSAGVTFASNNIPYIRLGAQTVAQNTPELRKRLEYAKGVHSFESDTTNADLIHVTQSLVVKEFIRDVVPTAEPEEYLRKQRLIRDTKPTVAAVLLFSDEPQAIIPKHCGIKVYRFKTIEKEGSREQEAFIPKTVEGCLYKQIYAAVALTKELIEQIPKMGSGSELVTVEYPPETLHEIITNAVIHRDYNITDDVHIRIFDNRVEVQSPGKLAANMTIKNLTTQRAARNGAIQRFLNKFKNPPNRDVGEGLKTAISAMMKKGLNSPIFEDQPNSFLVTIKHEKRASAEFAIMEFLESHPTINNKQARKITFINEDWRVKGIFRSMEKKRMIKQESGTKTRNTRYRKWTEADNAPAMLFPSEPERPS